jgi:hypothetical protein
MTKRSSKDGVPESQKMGYINNNQKDHNNQKGKTLLVK